MSMSNLVSKLAACHQHQTELVQCHKSAFRTYRLYYEYLGRNWMCYNEATLYHVMKRHGDGIVNSDVFFLDRIFTKHHSVWYSMVRHQHFLRKPHNPKQNDSLLYTLRLGQNGHHFVDNIFKCVCFNEDFWLSIKVSLRFVPKGPIDN